jgi:hypothetical protein
MGDLTSRLSGCTEFTKLDLQKGYFQVPIAAAEIAKTAIITPFGLFEFLQMPFGLKNAGMTFAPFIFGYLGDVLVASSSREEHHRHVREVLKPLADNSLVLNTDKCIWE